MSHKLLVIDDDESGSRLMELIFMAEGFEVLIAYDGETGLERAAAEQPDVVLLDLNLPGLDGMQVLERFKDTMPSLPVVMLTGSHDVKNAVKATQLGAFNYLTKPVNREEVVVVVGRALEARALRREVEELRRRVGTSASESLASKMGPSPRVKDIVDQVGLVAASNFTVLVLGETGTGKELVAQAIHQRSDRRGKPFVALDCGAIPEPLLESELFGHERGAFTGADRRKQGRLRLAEGGTCLLDEVGNLPMSLQVKLLRVLESRQVQAVGAERSAPMDVRFIAATNDDLQARVAQGLFRTDLYFRLAQYTITLPSLRDRIEDIPYLAQRFLEEASVELRRPVQEIVPEALDLLAVHAWPGNVRELRNVIRQAVLQTQELAIRANAIRAVLGKPTAPPPIAPAKAPDPSTELRVDPSHARAGQSLSEIAGQAARAAERQAITETLRVSAGNKTRAARLLKTDYKTLHTKMRHLGLRARDFAP